MTTRLADIATRQRRARARDAVFACWIALAAILGATAVGAVADAASPVPAPTAARCSAGR